jgi:hypothetical protein
MIMREVYAIFAGDPHHAVCLCGGSDAVHAQWFREAQKFGTVGAREVVGLWRVDLGTPDEHVIEIFGHVPVDIRLRYDLGKAMQRPSEDSKEQAVA